MHDMLLPFAASPSPLRPALGFLLVLAAALQAAPAQCGNVWLSGGGCVGTNGRVSEMTMWDPDGQGPLPSVPVVAGFYSYAGTTACPGIALLDATTSNWTPLLPWFRSVAALAVLPSGLLIAGGERTTGGSYEVATWNGAAWNTIGQFDDEVLSMTVMPNGDVVVGGRFTTANGIITNGIARYSGVSWQSLGLGFGNVMSGGRIVTSLCVLANGDLVAGGNFDFASGVPVTNVARWDGTAWSALGTELSTFVYDLQVMPNGDLLAGGLFAFGGQSGLARWNGTAWASLLPGNSYRISALELAANGDLLLAGWQDSGGVPLGDGFVAKLGVAIPFTTLGSAFPPDNAGGAFPTALLELPNGDLLVGGGLPRVASIDIGGMARFDGTDWQPVGAGLGRELASVAELANGDIVVGGYVSAGIVRQSGGVWSPLGGGVSNASNHDLPIVSALQVMPNGDLIAGGYFETAGGVAAASIARFDGVNWSPLGTGLATGGDVRAMHLRANGDLIVGGSFSLGSGGAQVNVAQWDGLAWSPLGAGVFYGVTALTEMPNGDLFAGSSAGLWRWDGTAWTSIASPFQPFHIQAMAVHNSGLMVAADNSVMFFNGSTWSWPFVVYGGDVLSLLPLPGSNDDTLIGGRFTFPNYAVMRYLGGSVGNGLGGTLSANSPTMQGSALAANGDALVVGYFFTAGGVASAYFARLSTTCSATATVFGSGCSGSAGPQVLTAQSLPWTGGTFTALATGMPANSIAVSVRGLTPAAVALPTILPQGQAGCDLLVSPDLLDLHVPTGNTLTTSFAIPNSILLVGQVLHQQVVPVELSVQGNLAAVTSTNRLTLTIGRF